MEGADKYCEVIKKAERIGKLIAEYEERRKRSAEKEQEMKKEIATLAANDFECDYEQKVRYSEAQKQILCSQVKADLYSLL